MAPKPTQQQLAKDLYLQTDKTQQEIADILDVNRRTVYLWVKNGKWAEMKKAAAQAPFLIQQDLHNHISAINTRIRVRGGDNCPTTQEVDMLRKLINMTAVIDKFHTGAYIEAFQELTTYIYHKDVDLARKVTMHADNYVKGHLGDDNDEYDRHLAENIARVEKNLENDTEVEDPALPPDPGAALGKTEQDQTVPSGPVAENTPDLPVKEGPALRNSAAFPRSAVLPNPSPDESLGEVNAISCDKDAITAPPVKNNDKQMIINEKDKQVTPAPYPISNFSQNEITRFPAQHKGFIDLPANEILGKG